MPITRAVSHDKRLVLAVAVGRIDGKAVGAYFESLSRAGAAPYRKLFDMTDAVGEASAEELARLGRYVARRAQDGPVGPVAIVVASEIGRTLAGLFDRAARADRPLRIFADGGEARTSLDSVAPLPSAPLPSDPPAAPPGVDALRRAG